MLTEKYRPQRWEDVVGQDETVAKIQALKKASGLGGRGYCLTGKTGTGKTSIARLIAAEIAGPLAIQEEDARDIGVAYVRTMEDAFSTRCIDFDNSGRTGKAWIFNEIHAFSDAVVTRLLTTLERVPKHCLIVFTTTAKAASTLFADYQDAKPFLQRCKRYELSQRDLAKPFAARILQICQAEGLGAPSLEQAVKLVNEESASLRGAIDRIEDGLFVAAA